MKHYLPYIGKFAKEYTRMNRPVYRAAVFSLRGEMAWSLIEKSLCEGNIIALSVVPLIDKCFLIVDQFLSKCDPDDIKDLPDDSQNESEEKEL